MPLGTGGAAQTVGGVLMQALGRIPRPGERFTYRGLEFDVLAASATRVERVAVRPGPARVQPLHRPEEPVPTRRAITYLSVAAEWPRLSSAERAPRLPRPPH